MRLSFLFSALTLISSVCAAPKQSPTTSTPARASPTNGSDGPAAADRWAQVIKDKNNNCRVKYSVLGYNSTSKPLGRYDASQKKCSYDGPSVQHDVHSPKYAGSTVRVFYEIGYPNVLKIFPGGSRFFFPLALTPGCKAWGQIKDRQIKDKWTFWADSRCHYDPAQFRELMPESHLKSWPFPFPSQGQASATPAATNAPATATAPPAIFKTNGPIKTWVGLYREGDKCKIWAQNLFEKGAGRSVPAGTFDTTTQKCKSPDGNRSYKGEAGPGNFVTFFYQDDPAWAGSLAGVAYVHVPKLQYQFPLGLQIGCQTFVRAANDTISNSDQHWMKSGCGVDLQKFHSALPNNPPVKTW